MQFLTITPPREPARAAHRELHLLIEPEPWLRVFLRNLADLFRKGPPRVWTTAQPAAYWEDALVHRPVAWARIRQSFLGHTLVLLIMLWINLWWLEQPQVAREEVPQTTITHYELSEYLPAITPAREKPSPPVRQHAQKADPEYAPQEIVSLHVKHSSLQQTIVQPSPSLIHQDVPLPNLIVNSALPAAPVVAGRPTHILPPDAAQVVPPAMQMVRRSQITFPVPPQPEVVAPASDIASAHRLAHLPAATPEVVPPSVSVASSRRAPVLPIQAQGPVVVAPSQSVVSRANQLTIPVQAPEVAPPPTRAASRSTLAQTLPDAAPQVVAPAQSATAHGLPRQFPEAAPQVAPPAPSVASRVLSALGIGAISPQTAPPPEPVAAGASRPQEQAIGQLLALNARPVPPAPTLSVPEGNRRGEFAAGPNGAPGTSARPETVQGDSPSDPGHTSGTTAASVFVAAPPSKIMADSVVAGPSMPPVPRASIPNVPSSDRIDNQIFGARRRYSIRLSMPNLNSAAGSWIMRFARLNSEPGAEEEISTPEPLRKVDPIYPASMIRDRLQGTVVLYAIIRADGSVADVRVLEGFDARLDENARAALEQWRFRPGTRNGVPIDVEAVVRVPFRVSKPAF